MSKMPSEELQNNFGKSGIFRRLLKTLFPLITLAIAVVVIYFSMSNTGSELSDTFAINIKVGFIFIALALYYCTDFIEIFRSYFVMKTTLGQKRLGLCTRNNLLAKYYDILTPFSSGGKPFQVYYLHKHKLNFGEVTTMVLSNYIIGRIGFQLATGIPLIFLMSMFGQLGGEQVVLSAVIIGIILNVGLTIGLIIVLFSNKLPKVAAGIGIWALHKIRLIKDKPKITKAVHDCIWQYRITMRRLMKQPWLLIGFISMSIVAQFMQVCIIIFIYLAVGGSDPAMIPLLILGVILTSYTALSTPIPGGTGAMELFFIAIFTPIFGTPEVFVALVIYKVFTYILPIVNGIPIVLYDAYKDRSARKNTAADAASHNTINQSDANLSLLNVDITNLQKETTKEEVG